MKTLLIPAPGIIELKDFKIPGPGPEEVRIKIRFTGFCGSDLSSFAGRNPLVSYPVVPGHEASGIIDTKGEKVPDKLKTGQPVTVVPYISCGECPSCLRGRPNACQFNKTMGVQRNGAMCDYITIHWSKVLASGGLGLDLLALTEPLTVGFHAASRGRVEKTDTVAVLGCGIIGIGAIISSANMGAKVIAVDIDDNKLKLAEELGAWHTINSTKQNLPETLRNLSGGRGPDLIIEAAGKPSTYLAAIESVAFSGRVVCIGYAKDDIAFATKLFVQKELDILGSRNACISDFHDVMGFLKKNKLPVDKIVTKTVPPESAYEAMQEWERNPGGIMKIFVEFNP